MTLYLDTEFNGHQGDLISIALVSDIGGHQFYGELPLPAKLDPWVAEHVVPLLHGLPEPVEELRMRLHHFLALHVPREEIVADWPDDFVHLMRAMSGPSFARSWMVPCRMCLVNSGDVNPEKPHNALSDAEALRDWCLAQDAVR